MNKFLRIASGQCSALLRNDLQFLDNLHENTKYVVWNFQNEPNTSSIVI